MKRLFLLLICGAFPLCAEHAEHLELGKETIHPLQFPKFSAGGELSLLRNFHAFNGSDIQMPLEYTYGAVIHSEFGLLENCNAGLTVSFTKAAQFLYGSNIVRIALFAKPYIPLTNTISFFSRLSLGNASSLFNEANGAALENLVPLGKKTFKDNAQKFMHTYGTRGYSPLSTGLTGAATIGAEFFVTKRLALVIEWGARADMLWARLLNDEVLGGAKDTRRAPSSGKESPSWFHYLIYDFPLTANIHIIL